MKKLTIPFALCYAAIVFPFAAQGLAAPGKIILTPAMVTNEVAVGNAGFLVDEQALSGDPKNSPPGGIPVTRFFPPSNGQTTWHYPVNAVIDLGASHELTHVYFFDVAGSGSITVSHGTPFNWTPLFTDGQASYNSWRGFATPVTTRYLQVSMATNISPSEIVLYGTPLGTPQPPPAPVPHTPPVFEKFMGINGFPSNPLHRSEAVGSIREYHDWSYCEGHTTTTYPGYPNNENGFQPAWTGRHYDTYYRDLKYAGMDIAPSILRNVRWLTGGNTALSETKPILINSGRDPLSPASYIEHADHMYQFAARYGQTAVADSALKLRASQPRLSGLGLVSYVENWNEQNQWWNGRAAYFKPYEYAAMSSADVDGHLGTMGATVGLRNADPNTKLVMAGLASPNLDYIKAMKFWTDYHRGGDFPWDVINVHHYCNNGAGQGSGTAGISPEADNLKGMMEAITQYRNQYLPGVEFWVSEFGYDSNSGSVQGAPAIGSFSSEEVQGQWLVRSFLALSAAGVDRAFAYILADQGPPTSTGLFVTCGITKESAAGYTPKVSWWYLYTLKTRLKGLRFEAEQSSGNANVRIYRFKDNAGVIKAYVLWCPTSSQTLVQNYQLTLQGTPGSAALVIMQSGDPDGVRTPLAINSGKVTLNVNERPAFVLVDNNTPELFLSTKLALTPSMVFVESGAVGTATRMVDEQSIAGDPRETSSGIPVTVWSPGTATSSACLDLWQMRTIDRIFIYDYNATGDLTISSGASKTGPWTTVRVDPLPNYRRWNMHVVNLTTRYLRFTRANGNSNFAEVVIYGK